MSLEVHTTFCGQIGGKSRVSCECVVSRGQSSFGRYEHFARWSGRYEHFRPLKRAVWTFRPILTPRHNWLHAALRTSMQCDFFRPFGHKSIFQSSLNSNDLQFYGIFYNSSYKAKFLNLKFMVSFSLLKLCSLRYWVISFCNICLGNLFYFVVGLLEFIKVFTPTLIRVFTLLTDVSHQGSRPAVSSSIVQKF